MWHWFSSQGTHDKDTNINDVNDGDLCDVRDLVKEVLPDDTWKAYPVITDPIDLRTGTAIGKSQCVGFNFCFLKNITRKR